MMCSSASSSLWHGTRDLELSASRPILLLGALQAVPTSLGLHNIVTLAGCLGMGVDDHLLRHRGYLWWQWLVARQAHPQSPLSPPSRGGRGHFHFRTIQDGLSHRLPMSPRLSLHTAVRNASSMTPHPVTPPPLLAAHLPLSSPRTSSSAASASLSRLYLPHTVPGRARSPPPHERHVDADMWGHTFFINFS